MVDHFGDNDVAPAAPVTNTFNGSVPAVDGACDVKKGPYAVGAGVRALDGFAAATIPTNDMVLNLYFGADEDHLGGHAVLAGAVPLRAGGRRAGRRLLRRGL